MMLVAESVCWWLCSSCWIFFQCEHSVTDIAKLSLTWIMFDVVIFILTVESAIIVSSSIQNLKKLPSWLQMNSLQWHWRKLIVQIQIILNYVKVFQSKPGIRNKMVARLKMQHNYHHPVRHQLHHRTHHRSQCESDLRIPIERIPDAYALSRWQSLWA